jgi:NAD(P)H-quinone oxidoreductase subunit 4L
MNLVTVLFVASALVGLGLWGALSQQAIVMLLMGVELMINGVMLAAAGVWIECAGGAPKGQLLVIVVMAVMAVEMSIGFALVIAVYRARQVDMTEGLESLRR